MKNCESMVYLNNAATSWPKPECVAEAMAEAVRGLPGSGGRGGIEDFDVFQAVREELAALMEISRPEQIALGNNSTWGMNQGIFGFPLEKGDTVLTTRAEHNAALRPRWRLEQEGIRVIYLDVDETGRIRPEAWEKALNTYRPRLCVLVHASNVTGAVNDGEKLTGLAHEYKSALLLDVSQSLGWLPVLPEKWGVDLAAFTGHKYLLGPQGTGGLYVRPGLSLKPYVLGGTGVRSDRRVLPEEMPLHLEAGTGNEPSYHGLLAALTWSRRHPADRRQTEKLLEYLREGLKKLGCRVICPKPPVTPVLSFLIPGISPQDAGEILTGSYDILCRTGLHCAPAIMKNLGAPEGTLRLSLSRFTIREELDRVLEAVEAILESVKEQKDEISVQKGGKLF